jgi:hypothetical protein
MVALVRQYYELMKSFRFLLWHCAEQESCRLVLTDVPINVCACHDHDWEAQTQMAKE